ncbi:beta-aspartyl-peptidase (threonine type) [Deinococcus reticulitermitis]|uniref:Beta-aspartyl-peptidase (Threonine type) n=1 Tax=Deinococcus reticulitermitis TaxID=856736 RepID=A0A1H6XRT4_9DEIO|nr:isoaspartyl peptidase/L-asparaginase [Deinococcus reticulitermitis]SEJ31739.1 beta-aspartyl-peptidase (threonine type) [Deinococcus reticulitermitis]
MTFTSMPLAPTAPAPILALHGGAGAIPRAELTPELDREAREGLRSALRTGWAVLEAGGPALDAVTAAVQALESHPAFNSGHGAAVNRAGFHELDASVMDGATGRAGAVAGVRHIRHPVLAARALLTEADPLLLIGEAADAWAKGRGLEMVDNAFFTTERRRVALDRTLQREAEGTAAQASEADRHGTVGAVALDRHGHLAAATSTGGYTAKPVGRVGDSPIIGAGTWADDRTCAVSGTGKGEHFIRTALAHTIHARMLYLGETLEQAAQAAIGAVTALGGGAGLCAVDMRGNVTLPFNTEGMYRGWISARGVFVAIHED